MFRTATAALAALLISTTLGFAQYTRSYMNTYNNSNVYPNNVGAVTPTIVNTDIGNVITSAGMLADSNNWTGSNIFSALPNLNCTGFLYGNGSGSQASCSKTSPSTSAFVSNAPGATTATSDANRFSYVINAKSDFGATGNAVSFSDGTITSGTNVFTSASATFTIADVGKTIIIDYAGAALAPLVTTISGYTSAHTVTLAANASTTIPFSNLWAANVVTAQSGGGSYAPNDVLTLSGGTSTVAATATVTSTAAAAATQVSNGSGGITASGSTTGICYVQGTTGSGPQKFVLSVNLSSGAIGSINGFILQGDYTTNPTNLSAEPVVPFQNCTGLSGATVSLTMGALSVIPAARGTYSVFPTSPVSTTDSGSGTGATLSAQVTTAGVYIYGTDDTTALTNALNASNTSNAAGVNSCVFIPAGVYIVSSPLPTFTGNGCVQGQGQQKTWIIASPSLNGDVFSWSEAWQKNNVETNYGGGLIAVSTNLAGPQISYLSIQGDRGTAYTQNALELYDRNDFANFHDIFIQGMTGNCLSGGKTKNTTQGLVRESNFYNIKCWWSGAASSPTIVFDSNGTTDSTNTDSFTSIDVYANFGSGFVIRSNSTSVNTSGFRIVGLRVEGIEYLPSVVNVDLFQVGDPSEAGGVNNIFCYECIFLDPYIGQYAIRVEATSSTYAPYNIDLRGSIGGGGKPHGTGLYVNYGRQNSFFFQSIYTYGTNIAFSNNAGTQNVVYGPARSEQAWTYSIGSGGAPVSYVTTTGNPQTGTGYVSYGLGDGSNWGGNTPGNGAVALGINNGTAYNIASGNYSAVVGGTSNVVTGVNSGAVAGKNVTDRGLYGVRCHASGSLTDAAGDANMCEQVLRCQAAATNASTCQLTADNSAAGAANILNIPAAAAYAVQMDCVALSRATPANNENWSTIVGLEARSAAAATTSWAGSVTTAAAATRSNGTVTGSTLAVAADTTNGGLTITFASPTTNSALWDATCYARTHQVQ